MLVILFRSRLRPDAGPGYPDMAAEMLERARAMPGFIDFKRYTADDGERLSVVIWENEETLRAWREDERHREAQRLGREQWYSEYSIEVAEVVRGREWPRAGA
jgi:heme-degrading monooxygenase HmoA